MPRLRGDKISRPGVLDYVFHRPYRDDAGLAQRLLRQRMLRATSLYRKDLIGHFGCVNAIEFSPGVGEWIISGGDDRRVLLWNTEECISGTALPQIMRGQHHSNIFCLAFDNDRTRILSGGNDEQVVLHDMQSGETLDVFRHEEAVYGLSVDPINNSVFASACDDGRILIYDTRAPPSEDPFCLAQYTSAPMHAVMYNPDEPRLLATANAKEGVGLWDIRKPRSVLLRYGGSLAQQSCMSVRFNQTGTQLIALRRRLPPVLYNVSAPLAVYQFDHAGYYNSCTMKSCCFAGDQDQWVVSGSDDFNLYVWRIPEEPPDVPWVGEAQLVLKGHRSIVNQVRCNPSNQLIISSGVEKVIKLWSAFALPGSQAPQVGETTPVPAERPVYTHEEYINLLLSNGHSMAHDYTNQSTEEDPRMIAFFDSLVQRELEGWSSDDSMDTSSDFLEHFVQPGGSESDSNPGQSRTSDTEAEARAVVASSVQFCEAVAPPSLDVSSPLPGPASPTQEDNGESQLLDLDHQGGAQNDEDDKMLPGQQTQSSRRSISDLITQRRKDYLAGIRRAEREARRIKQHKRRLALARKRRCVELLASGSSSESSVSADNDGLSVSSDTESQASDNEHVSGQVVPCKNTNLQLARLKRLRDRILQEDTDSNDSTVRVSTATSEPQPSTSTYHSCDAAAEPANHTQQHKPQPTNGVSGHNGVANGYNGTSADPLRLGPIPEINGNHPSNSQTAAEFPGECNHNNNNSENGAIDESDEAPTWTKFKRFRNKVERARRKYRRSSQDSSTDEV